MSLSTPASEKYISEVLHYLEHEQKLQIAEVLVSLGQREKIAIDSDVLGRIVDLAGLVEFLVLESSELFAMHYVEIGPVRKENTVEWTATIADVYRAHPNMRWPVDEYFGAPWFDGDCAVIECSFKYFDPSKHGLVPAVQVLGEPEAIGRMRKQSRVYVYWTGFEPVECHSELYAVKDIEYDRSMC